MSAARWGHVAEWLRSGLQNRLHQFNSGRGLQSNYLIFQNKPIPGLFCRSGRAVHYVPDKKSSDGLRLKPTGTRCTRFGAAVLHA
jgi:hypothetical protein